MSTTIPVIVVILLTITINSCSSENIDEFKYTKLKFNANQELIKTVRTVLGLHPTWSDKNSKPLLSESEVQEMLNGNWTEDPPDPKYHANDYCARDLARMALSIDEDWAKLMIDADGKIPPGIMYGHSSWVGSYRECLAAKAPPDPLNNNRSDTSFEGKYCTLTWEASQGKEELPAKQGSIGLCVPDTCEESDFVNINKSQQVFMRPNVIPQLSASKINISISVKSVTCQPKITTYTSGAIAVLVIIYIFLFLVITGTLLTVVEILFPISQDSCHEHNSRNVHINATMENGLPESTNLAKTENSEISTNSADNITLIQNPKKGTFLTRMEGFLKCFCLITNSAKILDTTDKGDSELRCIHGIRFLSMAWVILGHSFMTSFTTSGNILDAINMINNRAFQMILEATYSVDSFFVMSGFLLTHIFLREMTAREGKISWLAFYLHRFWRLTPVYMIVLAFNTTMPFYLISGPLRPVSVEDPCVKKWWWNLLYINNFESMTGQCMAWSWYLANDMQFYVISPIFLYPLWKWPVVGLAIIVVLFGSCLISTFAISYYYDAVAAFTYIPKLTEMLSWQAKILVYFDKIYVRPYTRINPYLIGVLAAYLLFQLKGRKNFLNRTFQILGWTISTGLALLLIVGLYNVHPSRVGTAFYNTLSRSIYSACLAWVMFACLTGHGDAVNKILSHSSFIPLGRLTYCAYLVHPIVMSVYFSSLPDTLIMTYLQMVMQFFGFLVLSYGVALGTSLLFESPMMAIERFLRNTLARTN